MTALTMTPWLEELSLVQIEINFDVKFEEQDVNDSIFTQIQTVLKGFLKC